MVGFSVFQRSTGYDRHACHLACAPSAGLGFGYTQNPKTCCCVVQLMNKTNKIVFPRPPSCKPSQSEGAACASSIEGTVLYGNRDPDVTIPLAVASLLLILKHSTITIDPNNVQFSRSIYRGVYDNKKQENGKLFIKINRPLAIQGGCRKCFRTGTRGRKRRRRGIGDRSHRFILFSVEHDATTVSAGATFVIVIVIVVIVIVWDTVLAVSSIVATGRKVPGRVG